MILKDKIVKNINLNYNIGKIVNILENNVGRQTHYIVETDYNKFFVKILDCKNKNIHMHDEIKVCRILQKNNVLYVPNYQKRIDRKFLTKIDEYLYFNIQNYIEGKTWKKYEANDWLLFSGIDIIGDIHNILKSTKLQQRVSILDINNTDKFLHKIELLKERINDLSLNDNNFILEDLNLREKILKDQRKIYLNDLTFVNGHSDYTITQLITDKRKIKGIVDFSEVSNIPAIWEIMRFYINSAPECKKQYIDFNKFNKFLKIYKSKIKLNKYDIDMLFKFNLYYFCQALSVYDKFIETNFSEQYINRIISRNNTIQCLLKY